MASHKAIVNLAVIVGIAAISIAAWAFFNRPMSAPDWPATISGFAYSPFRYGQDPDKGYLPV
jgi:exo-beta-1,3-glucanase (GH17 family)